MNMPRAKTTTIDGVDFFPEKKPKTTSTGARQGTGKQHLLPGLQAGASGLVSMRLNTFGLNLTAQRVAASFRPPLIAALITYLDQAMEALLQSAQCHQARGSPWNEHPVSRDINPGMNPVTHVAGESRDKNEIANRLSE
jgi:hypothetical protein